MGILSRAEIVKAGIYKEKGNVQEWGGDVFIRRMTGTERGEFADRANKIDKPTANIEKVKGDLASIGVSVEGFGGSISFQGVNSKEGDGINELLDLILLTSDMEELKYNSEVSAKGVILEAKIKRDEKERSNRPKK